MMNMKVFIASLLVKNHLTISEGSPLIVESEKIISIAQNKHLGSLSEMQKPWVFNGTTFLVVQQPLYYRVLLKFPGSL